jgi:hypothetical protein
VSIPKRVAAIEVSHWHSTYDASYLRILRDLGCDIVAVSDRTSGSRGTAPNALAARPSPTIAG